MKIWKQYNKRSKQYEWRARFRLNNKQFRPKEETKDKLLNLIAEIRRQEKAENDNKKFNLDLPLTVYIPTLREFFDEILPTVTNPKQQVFAKRVFDDFVELLPEDLKVDELTTFHFQQYINFRQSHLSKQNSEPLKPQTINKELFMISGGLKKAPQFFEQLKDWTRPRIPFLKEENSARELNLKIEDFYRLLETLRKKREGKQTVFAERHRRRLADELEFRLETGLRRKEVVRLQFKQYVESEGILKNVRRWKTKTTTKIFPLTKRAIELVETRKEIQKDCPFIFTEDGEPIQSDYRTLKKVCAKLDIPYGRYTEDGFIPHDLRHQAGTEMVRVADIKTAQIYLGHSDIAQTSVYLHTDAQRLKDAVRRRDEAKQVKADIKKELKNAYETIRNGEISEEKFIENMRKIFDF